MAGPGFEIQMGMIVDSQVSQDAPSLAPYKVGFQLLDKNDDDTRGVGVAVYKVGDEWVYVPAFYTNGRLRGTDLMYLPERKQFLPTTETWLAYLKGKSRKTLGQSSKSELADIMRGVPGSVDLQLDVGELPKMSMDMSVAAFTPPWTLSDMFSKDVPVEPPDMSLSKWVPVFGKEAAARLAKTLSEDADFANAILKWYSPSDLRKMAEDAESLSEAVKPSSGASDGASITVMTPQSPDAAKLGKAEKEALMRDGIFIVDHRPDTSTVFKGEVDHSRLARPNRTGVYDILMADGTFKRFQVFEPRKGLSGSPGLALDEKSPRKMALVDLDSKGTFVVPDGEVLGSRIDEPDKAASLRYKLFGQPATPTNLPSNARRVLVIDKTGNSYSFRVPSVKTAIGPKVKIFPITWGYGSTNWRDSDKGRAVQWVEFTGRDGKLFISGDTLFIPKGARFLKESDKKVAFGTPGTTLGPTLAKMQLKPLKVYSDGQQVVISSGAMSSEPLSKKAAVVRLAMDFGIDAATSKIMVKEASSANRPKADRYLVKLADSAMLSTAEHNIGYGDSPNWESDDKVSLPPLSQPDVQTAIQASDRGIKDVMDVSVLKSLADSGQPLDLVNDYVPDLFTAIDRVGRILFLFYWHSEAFSERYGLNELADLEDSLKNTFHSLGDLTLFLTRKNAAVDSSAASVAGDLAEDLRG